MTARRQLRPAMVVGIGDQGARIAERAAALARSRVDGVPVVRAVGLQGDTGDEEAVTRLLAADLDALYTIELLEAVRARGWEVKSAEGLAVFLVAALGEVSGRCLPSIAGLLRRLVDRHPARRAAVIGVLLETTDGSDMERDGDALGDALSVSPFPFDEGCYVLESVNERGLTLSDHGRREEMVARWIVEMTLTPLRQMVAALPLTSDEGARLRSFGLASWAFPAQPLARFMGHQLQVEMLEHLLAPPEGDGTQAGETWRRHCAPPALQTEEVASDLQSGREAWSWPGLGRLAELRDEIDAAAAKARSRLERASEGWTAALEASARTIADGLASEIAALLDVPGAGRIFLVEDALALARDALRQQAEDARSSAAYWRERREALAGEIEQAGTALTEAIAGFPSWNARTALRLLLSPYRWIALWQRYREIVDRAAVYVDCREQECILTGRELERAGLASFYGRSAKITEAWRTRLGGVRDEIEQVWQTLLICREDQEQIEHLLEAAALPRALHHHYYSRSVFGAEQEWTTFTSVAGPLSRWALREDGVQEMQEALRDFAAERFEFLKAVRLDTLLARTYSGAELRQRLMDLLEAASPFWAYDETELTPSERGEHWRQTWVGLPCASDSPLVELFPDRRTAFYDTGRNHHVVTVQVRSGLPLRIALAEPMVSRKEEHDVT